MEGQYAGVGVYCLGSSVLRHEWFVSATLNFSFGGVNVPELRDHLDSIPWLSIPLLQLQTGHKSFGPESFQHRLLQHGEVRGCIEREHCGADGIHPSYRRKAVIAKRSRRQASDSLTPSPATYLLFTWIQTIASLFSL